MKKKQTLPLVFLLILLGASAIFYHKRIQHSIVQVQENAPSSEGEISQTQLAVRETISSEKNMSTMVQVGSEDLSLYSQPDNTSEELTVVNRGEYMEYLDTSNDWYHVIVNNEWEGYVSSLYCEKVSVEETVTPLALDQTIVVLNPGHGGEDTGAVSNNEYYYEKEVTLSTALIIQKTLEEAGCTVILTRDSDTTESLDDICADSIENQADFFISLHYDSSEYRNEATGTTTYYYYDQFSELANTVNTALMNNLPLENRGVELGNFQVLRENTRPSLLLELGYMNNDDDLQTFMTDRYQEQVAEALLEGLTTYIHAT